MKCHVLSCDVMFAMPPPMLRRPVPAYRASLGTSFRPGPFVPPPPGRPARRDPVSRVPPARPCAGGRAYRGGAVRARDCPRARSGPRAHLTPSPGKGPKNPPAAHAAGLLPLCTIWNIIETIGDLNPCGEILWVGGWRPAEQARRSRLLPLDCLQQLLAHVFPVHFLLHHDEQALVRAVVLP